MWTEFYIFQFVFIALWEKFTIYSGINIFQKAHFKGFKKLFWETITLLVLRESYVT